jgi:hypothetical protein
MTEVVLLSVGFGIGVLGVVYGIRRPRLSLDTVLQTWERPLVPGAAPGRAGPPPLGAMLSSWVVGGRWSDRRWVHSLLTAVDLTSTDPEAFATRVLVLAAVCGLTPFLLWLVASMAGADLPAGAALLLALAAVPGGAALQVSTLLRRAEDRRRHFRVVVGSFVDLVVLGLAGGVGIDGAMHAAAQVTPDWAAQRLGRALSAARDGGTTPWAALEALGRDLGVRELVELSTTVQLAGTEGARIRQSLTARSASLRRHEQAEAESSANAMTERLFLPGALLLIGFLLFIGYPAVHRILGGF